MSAYITFTGNAGRDPETRQFNNGGSITSIPVAINQGYYDKAHNWVDQGTMWIDVEASADNIAAQIQAASKGSKLVVAGSLQQRTFTTRDGRDATALKCRATAVCILPKNTAETAAPASQSDDPWASPQNNNSEFGEPDF